MSVRQVVFFLVHPLLVITIMAAEFTDNEIDLLVSHLKTLGLKPKLDTPEDLQQWMQEYVKATTMSDEESDDHEEEEESAKSKDPVKPVHINTLATIAQLPRVSTFSGDSSKTDAPFDLWKYEVKCLVAEGTYSPNVILHAVRKSLKGEAGRIAMRLGTQATILELLDKLEGVYGTVHRSQTLLADFYSAQQEESETVATWGCRLEDLLDKASRKGQVNKSGMDEMLRTKFWTGLRPALKDRSSHKFDSCKTFDELRVQLRMIEYEMQQGKETTQKDVAKKPAQVKAVTSSEKVSEAHAVPSSEISELKGLIHKLGNRIDHLQQQMEFKPSFQNKPAAEQTFKQESSSSKEMTCWRCGQVGHIRYGCRVRLDHLNQTPNGKQSAFGASK